MTAIPHKADLSMNDSVSSTTHAGVPLLLKILSGASVLGVALGLVIALFYTQADSVQGDVQRIFYIHMPAFIGAFVAFLVTVVGGVMYLRTRDVKWDSLALAGVEVGLALTAINLITGMIWAKPTWGTFWTWDPRLTLEAIQGLTYLAYLMLRAGLENPEKKRRFASVYGIFAIITVLLVIMIIRVTPTIHPVVTSAPADGGLSMAPDMRGALGINMPVWALLVPITLIWYRVRLQNLIERVAEARAQLLSRGK